MVTECARIRSGGVGEWLKPAVLKTVRLERVSGVRIPPPPPPLKKTCLHCGCCEFVIQNNMCYRSGIMSSNEKTVSFRAVAERIEALDSLATAQGRPRSYLINEAITNYIELHAYQDALVRKGLEEMRKGRVVSHEQVLKRLKRTGRARQ